MHVKKIKLNDKGHPKKVTVEMTVDEAGIVAVMLGKLSWQQVHDVAPGRESDSSEVYDCLTGEFFNKYWDDGVNGWLRGVKPGSELL